MKKKIAFIINGNKVQLKKLTLELRKVFDDFFESRFYISKKKPENKKLAGKAIAEGCNVIINVGGDGSLNQTLNGVMRYFEKHPNASHLNDIKLGLLPSGSGNDFARMFGIEHQPEQLLQWIMNDSHEKIDIGLAEYVNRKGKSARRYFINITDVGMGGIVAKKVDNKMFRWLSPFLIYQKAIIETLLTYKKQTIVAHSDDFEWNGKVMNFIVANGKYFGSGLGIAPDASPLNGKFNIVVLGDISLKDYFLNLSKVKKCEKITHPSLNYFSTKSVFIDSPQKPVPIDMDGDYIGYTPVKLTVIPKKISFFFEKNLLS